MCADLQHFKYSLFYQNVGGMRTKSTDFVLFMSSREYDIVVITETWLHYEINSAEYFDSYYTVYRRDRYSDPSIINKGGGVLIAVKANYNSELYNLHYNFVEQLCIKLTFLNNTCIYIVISYIPPNSSFETYKHHLDNIQKIIDNLDINQYIFVLGDFNLNNLMWIFEEERLVPYNIVNDIDEFVIGFFLSNDFKQFNCYRNDISRTLDLIFASDYVKAACKMSSNPISCNTVHHKALDFHFEFFEYDNDKIDLSLKYNFNKADFIGLNTYFETIDWSFLSDLDSPEVIYEKICYKFDTAIDMYVPKQKPRLNNKPPWFNSRLCNLKNITNKSHKIYKKSGDENDRRKFELARKEFTFFRDFLYKKYISNIENNIKLNASAFWNYINSRKDNSHRIPKHMLYGDMKSDGNEESCDLFAKFFQSTFIKPYSNTSESFPLNYVTVANMQLNIDDVLIAINSLKNDSNCSIGTYPSIFFKKCSLNISMIILKLLTACLDQGKFLDCWKVCNIVPIFKSGDRSQVTNYRPIIMQCTFAKIFDIILKKKLFELVEDKITPYQHGFMPGRSTATNLMLLTHDIVRSMEGGSQCDVVYTDFSKAFDTVSHKLLIRKLCMLGLPHNLCLVLINFLEFRKLTVSIENCSSSHYINAYSGIPQGTHIGPLLFILFINDLPNILKFTKCLLFADDLKLYSSVSDISDCQGIQADLKCLTEWCLENEIMINVSKCNSVTYTHSISPLLYNYKIGNSPLKRSAEVKDLGVIFDSKLSFSSHVDYITSKAYSTLGFIRRNSKEFRDHTTLKSLYVSLVRSKLEYCSIVWNPYYLKYSTRIEKVQKLFTRVIFKKLNWPEVVPYISRRKYLGLQQLSDRRSYFCIMFVYNVLSGNINCAEINELMTVYEPPRVLRCNRIFEESLHRTNYALNEPIARCLKLCNNIAPTLNFNVSKDIFKLNLFKLYN